MILLRHFYRRDIVAAYDLFRNMAPNLYFIIVAS